MIVIKNSYWLSKVFILENLYPSLSSGKTCDKKGIIRPEKGIPSEQKRSWSVAQRWGSILDEIICINDHIYNLLSNHTIFTFSDQHDFFNATCNNIKYNNMTSQNIVLLPDETGWFNSPITWRFLQISKVFRIGKG